MSYYSNERRGSSAGLSVVLFVAAFNIGSLIGRLTENAEGKVHDVQITNEQLYDELDVSHNVEQLIVDPEQHTFVFREGVLTCTGSYEGAKTQAHVAGQLACTELVPVTK